MATHHDTALGAADGSGNDLNTGDALAVTVGDLCWATVGWEGAAGAVPTMDTGASTPLWTACQAAVDHDNNDLHGATFRWVATATGTVTPRFRLDSARTFRKLRVMSETPAALKTLAYVDASNGGTGGTGSSLTTGAADAGAAGFSGAGFVLYGSRDFTDTSSPAFTEPAEFDITSAITATYRLQSGAGSLTATGTIPLNSDFVTFLDVFDEEDAEEPPEAPPSYAVAGDDYF